MSQDDREFFLQVLTLILGTITTLVLAWIARKQGENGRKLDDAKDMATTAAVNAADVKVQSAVLTAHTEAISRQVNGQSERKDSKRDELEERLTAMARELGELKASSEAKDRELALMAGRRGRRDSDAAMVERVATPTAPDVL